MSARPRKRKVRDEKGQWVDPKDLEGRVIEHGVKVEEGKAPNLQFFTPLCCLMNIHAFQLKAGQRGPLDARDTYKITTFTMVTIHSDLFL
jgi:hypothetical protein